MMRVSQIVEALGLAVGAGDYGLNAEVTGAYASDMLSCAMAGAAGGNLWVTLQGHLNIIAVATLNDLAGVIVTEGKPVPAEALAKANEEGIPILMTRMGTFEVCGRLWNLLSVEG